jgi:predicted oxidoreductase
MAELRMEQILAVRVRQKLEEIGKKYNSNVESTAVAWLVKLGALP